MHWRVLAVALVAATAGCGSIVGTGSPTETVTPAPVPTLEPTPTDPRVGVAPGVDARGISDPEDLIEHHVSAATGANYVWQSESREIYRLSNSTVWRNISQRVVVEDATTYRRSASSIEQSSAGQRVFLQGYEEYADGERRYLRWSEYGDPDVSYRSEPATNASRELANVSVGPLRQYLDLETQSVARLSTVDDRQRYRITGSRDSVPQFGTVENYTARAVVREDGFVRSVDVSFRTTRADRDVRIAYTSQYTRVGNATVTEPDWFVDERGRFDDG